MESFATLEDVIRLWRALTPEETERTRALLPVVSDALRWEAKRVHKDLDRMIDENPVFFRVVQSVTVDVIARTLMTSTNQEPMTQASESALGYSVSGTFLVPGGGLFIKNAELARLGLKNQRYGALDFYDIPKRSMYGEMD